MASRFAAFGNDLYTGARSYNFVGSWRRWLAVAAITVVVCIIVLLIRGLNPSIEFRGGSQFQISGLTNPTQQVAVDVVNSEAGAASAPRVSVLGGSAVQVQTERLSDEETTHLREELARAYDVDVANVTSSYVGASWGADVTQKALLGMLIFIVLVTVVITLYFRAWQMALAAIVATIHDLILTAGIYSLVGFEVSPASVIGFLTILGYSLYDTVVVFDKIRENTAHIYSSTKRTYAEAVNYAVNQTLVRSINTSVVALLPVGAILVIGAYMLGAGTLKDISLALFVGMLAGTYSSIFIGPPLIVLLRSRDPRIIKQAAAVEKVRQQAAQREADGEPLATAAAGPVVRQRGPRNQPKRHQPRSKRK